MEYDIIGDIHGCANTLIALLVKLGYEKNNGIYHHPEKIDHLAFNNPPHYEWNHTALFLHFSAFYH